MTVHCSDRGALLAEIRQRYTDLLANVPIQVKSLHDEMEAQRVLDRKLMLGLDRFKELLSSLTKYEVHVYSTISVYYFTCSDLGELKAHNEIAGEEIRETKDNVSVLTKYSLKYKLTL